MILQRLSFKSESELIHPFRQFCIQKYHDVKFYNEVYVNYSRKVDSIMTIPSQENERMAIELKLHLNLKVIEQAYRNKKYNHYSSVVVPISSINSKNKDMIIKICQSLGIGCYLIKSYRPYYETDEKNYDWGQSVFVLYDPFKDSNAKNFNPKDVQLFEKQLDYVEAGSASGSSWTEFKETVERIHTWLEENDGKGNIKDILTKIQHHYSNAPSGARTLKKYMMKGIILEDYGINDIGYDVWKK